MKKFTVDRNTWYRGNGADGSFLLNNTGQKCCVGFFAEQILELSPTNILHKGTLATINSSLNDLISNKDVYITNDNPNISDLEREELLMVRFRELGYEVEFIN